MFVSIWMFYWVCVCLLVSICVLSFLCFTVSLSFWRECMCVVSMLLKWLKTVKRCIIPEEKGKKMCIHRNLGEEFLILVIILGACPTNSKNKFFLELNSSVTYFSQPLIYQDQGQRIIKKFIQIQYNQDFLMTVAFGAKIKFYVCF